MPTQDKLSGLNCHKKYGAQVHAAYLRMGTKLRNTVRTRNNVKGVIAFFATGTAEDGVCLGAECRLYDYYAGDWQDRLDECAVLVNANAYALGRKTDALIITELDKSTNYALDGTTALTKDKVLKAFEMLGEADVSDDGEHYAIVGWKQWSDLLQIPEFADADYVRDEELPWKGTQAKHWLGTLWMPHSGLLKSGGVRKCYWYHRTAIGHAYGAEVKSEITYHGDRAAWFCNNMMSQGAVLVDPARVVSMRCLEA